jgi:ribonuclease PH
MKESEALRRPGGRASNSIRPLSCELSCLQNADGSAQFSAGSTAALASVQGPVAPRLPQHENPGGAVVSVIVKSPSSSSSSSSSNRTYELEWEQILTRVLFRAIVTELYPRTVIQIVVQILTIDGSVLAVVLHAAVSALMDAGIELRYLPTATTCLYVPTSGAGSSSSDSILLDPSAEEEQGRDSGTVVVVTQSGDEESVLAIHTSNACLLAHSLLQCCKLAHRTSPAIVAFWRLVLKQKAAREAQTLWSGAASSDPMRS